MYHFEVSNPPFNAFKNGMVITCNTNSDHIGIQIRPYTEETNGEICIFVTTTQTTFNNNKYFSILDWA